jgi:hypothetical protein
MTYPLACIAWRVGSFQSIYHLSIKKKTDSPTNFRGFIHQRGAHDIAEFF